MHFFFFLLHTHLQIYIFLYLHYKKVSRSKNLFLCWNTFFFSLSMLNRFPDYLYFLRLRHITSKVQIKFHLFKKVFDHTIIFLSIYLILGKKMWQYWRIYSIYSSMFARILSEAGFEPTRINIHLVLNQTP